MFVVLGNFVINNFSCCFFYFDFSKKFYNKLTDTFFPSTLTIILLSYKKRGRERGFFKFLKTYYKNNDTQYMIMIFFIKIIDLRIPFKNIEG